MVRSVLAVIAGFLVTTMIVMIATVITAQLMFGEMTEDMLATFTPTPTYLVINILYGVLAAMIGGYYTAWVARRLPVRHGMALALLILIMGVVTIFVEQQGNQPVWYSYVMPVLGAMGAVMGSRLRR